VGWRFLEWRTHSQPETRGCTLTCHSVSVRPRGLISPAQYDPTFTTAVCQSDDRLRCAGTLSERGCSTGRYYAPVDDHALPVGRFLDGYQSEALREPDGGTHLGPSDVGALSHLLDPATPNLEIDSENLVAAAKILGVQVHIVRAGTPAEVGSAIETIAQRRLGPVVVGLSPFFNTQGKQLAAHMVRHALPAIFQTREFATAGGLISYGGSLLDAYRIAGIYTGRILKGEKPANLPVQQVSKFELFINLNTAKALGVTVPPTLLARADEVFE
jgi:hypothetical protein